jgi:hypothetical protein
MLEGERHAGRPLAAHADAEERPAGEEHGVGGREAAEHREQREPHDREHQWQLASPPIRRGARRRSADQTEHQRDGAQRAGQRVVDRKAALNIGKHKREDGEVEPVEHPSEERGGKRPLLLAREGSELAKELEHCLLVIHRGSW